MREEIDGVNPKFKSQCEIVGNRFERQLNNMNKLLAIQNQLPKDMAEQINLWKQELSEQLINFRELITSNEIDEKLLSSHLNKFMNYDLLQEQQIQVLSQYIALQTNNNQQNIQNSNGVKISVPLKNSNLIQISARPVPDSIPLHYLHSNGKLLSDNEIKKAKKYMEDNNLNFCQAYIKRKDGSGVTYDLVYSNNNLQVIVSKPLGSGTYGTVRVAQDMGSSEFIAAKIQDTIPEARFNYTNKIEKEYETLRKTNQTRGELIFTPEGLDKNKSPKNKQGIIMEVLGVGQDAEKYLVDNNDIQMSDARWLQLGFNFLQAYKTQVQERGYLFRDIKPSNTIYNSVTGEFYFVDWDKAVEAIEGKSKPLPYDCSPEFMAPEFDPNTGNIYNEASEVYALGISLRDMITEHPERIKDEQLRSFFNEMIECMTHPEPSQRATLQECFDILQTLMEYCHEVVSKRRIAIFDIQEYDNAGYFEKKRLIQALKAADEVWFLDTASNDEDKAIHDPLKRAKLQRELQDSGVRVSDRFYSPNNTMEKKEIVSEIVDDANQEQTNHARGFYFVSLNQKSLDETKVHAITADTTDKGKIKYYYNQNLAEVDQDVIKKIKNGLTKEMFRLQGKYPQTENSYASAVAEFRVAVLDEFLKNLDKKNTADKSQKYTFHQLETDLHILASKMATTGFFRKTSEGEENIRRLTKQFKQESDTFESKQSRVIKK